MIDVYYNQDYVKLYETKTAKLFTYMYKKQENIFINNTLRIGNILKSAYGYGGYQFNTTSPSFIEEAMHTYDNYLRKIGITKEVIMWHPFNDVYKKICNDVIEQNRQVAVVLINDKRKDNYSQTTRNILRKMDGLELQRTNDVDLFLILYQKTMDRLKADGKYYFTRKYFTDLLKLPGVEMYAVKKDGIILTMGMFFMTSQCASYHLSSNTEQGLELKANYFLLDKVFDIADERKIGWFLLGGGKTPDDDDSLLKYKLKFTKTTFPFYITERNIG